MERFHPLSGFPQDFESFLKDFLENESLRFRVFAEVWRKHNFSFIICGRQSQMKLDDFLNCLFYQLVDYTQPPYEIEMQVCAFYMLYGFYFKQPVKGHIRIRVTNTEWRHLLKLEADMRQEAHWDLVYVFHSLCSAKAFHFCATRQPYFPLVPIYPLIGDDCLPQNYGKSLSTVIGLERLQMVEDIVKKYQLFKEKLPSQQGAGNGEGRNGGLAEVSKLTPDLNLVRSNFISQLREKILKGEQEMNNFDEEFHSQSSKRSQQSASQEDSDKDEQAEESFSMESLFYTAHSKSADAIDELLASSDDNETGEGMSSSSQRLDDDEHWRTRSRRTKTVDAAEEGSDDDLANLSIGERRKQLKSRQYGSPIKVKLPMKRRKSKT